MAVSSNFLFALILGILCQEKLLTVFHLYLIVDDPHPEGAETSGNLFIDSNTFQLTSIPSLSQERYYKKPRFTVASSLF